MIGVKYPTEMDVEFPRAYVVKRPGPESHALDEQVVKGVLWHPAYEVQGVDSGCSICRTHSKECEWKDIEENSKRGGRSGI